MMLTKSEEVMFDFPSLPTELKVHTLSFFPKKDRASFACTSWESRAEAILSLKIKLADGFNCHLPMEDSQLQSIYEKLCKERELFIFASVSLIKDPYFARTLSRCHVYENSFSSLLDTAKQRFGDHKEEQQNALDQFNNLLKNPGAMEKKTLMEALSILCQMDAYNTLHLIFKNYPDLPIDSSALLTVAINSLNLKTIETLIECGVDVNQPLFYESDIDVEKKIHQRCFCSPLYYAIILPANPRASISSFFAGVHRADNFKLVTIIKWLLMKGANPEQKCIITTEENLDLTKTENKTESDMSNFDCKILCQSILDAPSSKDLNIKYLDTLQDIIDWTPGESLTPAFQP